MKIALIGYGKMGRAIEKIAIERGHEIVCRIDADNQDDFESPEFAKAEVAIEFHHARYSCGQLSASFLQGSTCCIRHYRLGRSDDGDKSRCATTETEPCSGHPISRSV